MRRLMFILRIVLTLLRAVAYGWLLALVEIVRRHRETVKKRCFGPELPHPDRHPTAPCITFEHPAFRRPDPCIYSQAYLTGLGLPVTWDNPDIALLRNGAAVPEHGLEPGELYEIEATVWNNSYDAPVLGMEVEFSFLSFGVGTVQTPIGRTTFSLGVKGGPGHPAKTRIPWTTPPTPGHYCIQAKLICPDDANPLNNVGQNNVDVALAQSPAHFTFTLRNSAKRERSFRFRVDAYTPIEPPECSVAPPEREPRSKRLERVVARHKARDFSVPDGWTVAIAPDEVSLAPGAEAAITVDVTPPAGFSGERAFNVNAFGGGQFAGGVTLVARSS